MLRFDELKAQVNCLYSMGTLSKLQEKNSFCSLRLYMPFSEGRKNVETLSEEQSNEECKMYVDSGRLLFICSW